LELLHEVEDVGEFQLSPDGRWLLGVGWAYDYRDESADRATEIGHGLVVIDTRTLEEVGRYRPDTAFSQLAISPDSRFAYLISTGPGQSDAMVNEGCCDQPCLELSVVELPNATPRATRGLFGGADRLFSPGR